MDRPDGGVGVVDELALDEAQHNARLADELVVREAEHDRRLARAGAAEQHDLHAAVAEALAQAGLWRTALGHDERAVVLLLGRLCAP